MNKPRLTRQSWIDAGLAALVAEGPGVLAAETLARQMGTTKGSFYWHFKDVPDFHAAIGTDWQTRAFAQVVDALAETAPAEQRLLKFGKTVLSDRQDPALRSWARTHKPTAKIVAQVDAERLKYMANLLRQIGIANEEFAQSCLGALVGMPQLPGQKKPAAAWETLIDLVLALK